MSLDLSTVPYFHGGDKRVEDRSYTAMCLLWRKMRTDEPPTYESWVAQVAKGRVIISRQECDYEDSWGACALLKDHDGDHLPFGDDIK